MIRTQDLGICSLNHCATLLVNVFGKEATFKTTLAFYCLFRWIVCHNIEMSHTTFKKKWQGICYSNHCTVKLKSYRTDPVVNIHFLKYSMQSVYLEWLNGTYIYPTFILIISLQNVYGKKIKLLWNRSVMPNMPLKKLKW